MDPIQLAQMFDRIREQYSTSGLPNAEQQSIQTMADYARMVGAPVSAITQAANIHNPGGNWTPETIQSILGATKPQAGLMPSVTSLGRGVDEATSRIGETQQRVSDLFGQGQGFLAPYQGTGTQANQLQAALSGALGREAQQAAFNDYISSPGVQFAQQQGEQALLRNQAAIGGLGGANVRRALTELGTGFALQDYGNQFARLGDVATRGLSAATTGAGLSGQQAGIQANLGQFSAGLPMQAAMQESSQRFQAGRDIAGNIGGTSSALANLLSQGSAGVAGMIGQQGANLGNIYQAAAQGDANAQAQLAQLLAQTNMQASGQVAGLPTVAGGQTNYLGQTAALTGAAAGLLQGYQPQNQPVMGPQSPYNTQPGYGPSYTQPYNPAAVLGGF